LLAAILSQQLRKTEQAHSEDASAKWCKKGRHRSLQLDFGTKQASVGNNRQSKWCQLDRCGTTSFLRKNANKRTQ